MKKTVLSASAIVITILSTLAVAQSPTPRAPAAGAGPASLSNRSDSALRVVRPITTSPAIRAADPARKILLAKAMHLSSSQLTKAQYLKLMHAVWVQDLDANSDGKLSWQSGPESLGSKIDACVVVKYKKQEAKKEKDPSKPGVWIETPEAWVPEDWVTWADVLGETSFKGGQCEVIGVETIWKCMTPDGNKPMPPPESKGWNISLPKPSCTGALGFPVDCSTTDPVAVGKAECERRGGVYQAFTKMDGCEKWQHFGPDSEEAFLKVADLAFNAEDHDSNGVIEAGESQYLCLN